MVRHKPCGSYFEEDVVEEGLYTLVGVVAEHGCNSGTPEPAGPTEVEQAAQELRDAYRAATGINVFDTQTIKVARAAQKYMLAIVQAERAKAYEEFMNSGADQSFALDALDNTLDRLEDGQYQVP